MFKYYEIIDCLEHKYKIKIIDDDFEEIVVAESMLAVAATCNAIIKIYSKRQLPVVKNLVLLILKLNERKYLYCDIKYIIEYLQKYVPEFNQYKNEVEKILLFN